MLFRSSSMNGIAILNQVVDTLPQLDQCLQGDSQQALGSFISTSVKLAASFAGSGQDSTGSALATTVSKLTTLVREKKYSKILRKLNQQEFMASMACLMEVTSETYCQARDAMGLFKKGMEDLQFRKNENDKITPQNPFAGYYVLNTHVPNVTRWMQKIQIGVDPKLPTDAIFQNKIQQEVADFYKGVKTLLGEYNSALLTIKSLPGLQAKQNSVLKLIVKINDSALGNYDDGGKTNFFTMSRTAISVPFSLIGIPIPDQVAGRVMPKLDYNEWLQVNMTTIPAFSDPVALAETIGRNMQALIQEANLSAIEYFNKWYIVDKQALVNESTININYTVRDSLKAIYDYNTILRQHINQYGGDTSIVPAVIDLQIRIDKVLRAYNDVENMGKQFSKQNGDLKSVEKDLPRMAEVYEKLINIVYDQFNVMQSRSGFIANRMVNFVNADYDMLIKNNVNFSSYQKDLFLATGMAAFDKMLQIYNGNPANVQTDLEMALRINRGNIEVLEALLKDNVISTIAELAIIERGDHGSVKWDSMKRLMHDTWREQPGMSVIDTKGKAHPQYFSNIFLIIPRIITQWFNNPDRYTMSPKMATKETGEQSEFDEVTSLQSRLCIQALAFNDQSALRGLCKDRVLLSPLKIEALNVAYDKEIERYLGDKSLTAQKQKAFNSSSRICAFRDYNRRNMVQFMSVGKR